MSLRQSDFLGANEPRSLENAYLLLHAGKAHLKPLRKSRDQSVRPPKLLQNPAPRSIRNRAERGIETLGMPNHMVYYITHFNRETWPKTKKDRQKTV
jgi:hypothetical protein